MIWGLVVALIYAQLAEYVAHRWLMHRPFPTRSGIYVRHAIEHHGRSRNDLNISISPLTSGAVASPLLFGCWFCGWTWMVAVVLLSIGYSATWTAMHNAHHDLAFLWLQRIPGYGRLRRHHLLHHRFPHKNFGAVFIWSDFLFGTKV